MPTIPPLFEPRLCTEPRSTNPLYFCPPLLPYSNRDFAPSPDQLTRSNYAHHSSPIRTETLHRAPINCPALLLPTIPPLFEPRLCTEPRSTDPLYLCPPLFPYSNR